MARERIDRSKTEESTQRQELLLEVPSLQGDIDLLRRSQKFISKEAQRLVDRMAKPNFLYRSLMFFNEEREKPSIKRNSQAEAQVNFDNHIVNLFGTAQGSWNRQQTADYYRWVGATAVSSLQQALSARGLKADLILSSQDVSEIALTARRAIQNSNTKVGTLDIHIDPDWTRDLTNQVIMNIEEPSRPQIQPLLQRFVINPPLATPKE